MPKRLIVCCDGTWDTADQSLAGRPNPTNVTKVALCIASQDRAGISQCVYYHSGVGTGRWDRLGGGGFGFGLGHNVFDAYRFLIDNYEPGDELFFFGFSRGAFTARSLGGLVRSCGILHDKNASRIQQAWVLYRSSAERPSGVASTLFRRAYSHEPRIHFIGVWDTVGALGIPVLGPRWLKPVIRWCNRRWEFHDTKLSTGVDGGFHALAIDEQRAPFVPTLWHQQPDATDQEIKQVWFTGVHSDIGGGYADTSLSDITLLWMADRAREYGLEFVPGAFSADGPATMTPADSIEFTVAPDAMGAPHNSRTGLYRLSRPVDRPIGTACDSNGRLDGHEYLSTSAKEHYDAQPSYRSPQLVKYLATPADVHLERA